MLATIRKWVLVLLFLGVGGFLLYQWIQFRQIQALLPAGTSIAGLDVSGMTEEQANQLLIDKYYSPVYFYHREEHVELDPQSVGFILDMESMLGQVQQELASRDDWLHFVTFVLDRPLRPVSIQLSANHDPASLKSVLESVSDFLDQPAQPAQMFTQGQAISEGEAGYVMDVDASLPLAEEALYRSENRVAQLVVVDQEVPEMNIELLAESIETKLQSFDGMGSIFIMDLESGEEIGINSDVAMSGLSILKIGIFVEAYRALDEEPDAEQQKLFLDTATRSSNFGANLLLHIVAGEDNTYAGADILTESMKRLGLVNTFMAVPYDATPPGYRQTTYITPANTRSDVSTEPDETMQSTAEEIGTLLAMIYYCAKGGGPLLAVYPESITPSECQAIIDLMVLNEEGNLIRYGVPDGIPVSHKHGWARATHADAGIVLSPGGDYVIVEFLNQPGDWLLADESFPILREIARSTYNYFNMDNPYLGDALIERGTSIDPDDPFSEQHATETPDSSDTNADGGQSAGEAGADEENPNSEKEDGEIEPDDQVGGN